MRKAAIITGVLAGLVVLIASFNPLELKLKAGLQVTTGEVPASLFLDGSYLDKSPYRNDHIQPNDYLLRIAPDGTGFAPYELPIKLHKGTVTIVTWKPGPTVETSGGIIYEMERVGGNQARVEINSIPDGAIITLDGGEKRFGPTTYELTGENHELEISLPSFQTQQHSVRVPKGHKATLTVILGKIDLTQSNTPAMNAPSIEAATDSAQTAP